MEGEGREEKRREESKGGKRKKKGKINTYFMCVWMNKGRERREGIKNTYKILFYYFIIVNYKLIINYENIKVILQKKKIKTFQDYKCKFMDLEEKKMVKPKETT